MLELLLITEDEFREIAEALERGEDYVENTTSPEELAMDMLTAFTSRLGRGQGRLLTSKATGGDYAFVLGEDEPGRFFELGLGDHTEVTQSTDLTGVKLVRALLRLRVPASTPANSAASAHASA